MVWAAALCGDSGLVPWDRGEAPWDSGAATWYSDALGAASSPENGSSKLALSLLFIVDMAGCWPIIPNGCCIDLCCSAYLWATRASCFFVEDCN